MTEHENDKGEKAEKTVVTHLYKFRSTTAGAIDAFVDKTYEWYIEELKKQEDNSRYLYEMQLNSKAEGGGEDGGAASRVFKRYKLPLYLPISPFLPPYISPPRASSSGTSSLYISLYLPISPGGGRVHQDVPAREVALRRHHGPRAQLPLLLPG